MKTVLKQCVSDHIDRIGNNLSTNIKALRRYTKAVRVTNSYPKRYNNRETENGSDIVNLFADDFSSVYRTQSNITFSPEFLAEDC